MDAEKKRHNLFINMKLITKLMLSFLVFIIMLAALGGASLFFINKIVILADVASPLVTTTSVLVSHLEKTLNTVSGLLSMTDVEKIQEQTKVIDQLDGEFQATTNQLSGIIAENNLQLDIQPLQHIHRKFFEHLNNMISARKILVMKEAAAGKSLEDLEKQRHELDAILSALATWGNASINEKEDHRKTMIQSGQASVEKLDEIMSELFSSDLVRRFTLFSRERTSLAACSNFLLIAASFSISRSAMYAWVMFSIFLRYCWSVNAPPTRG